VSASYLEQYETVEKNLQVKRNRLDMVNVGREEERRKAVEGRRRSAGRSRG